MRDTKYALSISPFLVLDDNTRICKRDNIFQTTTKFEQGAKLPLKVCISTFKIEEVSLEFVGSIPLDRRFNQYGIPKMIMMRNQIP
jgi:hypothetical protein